MAAYPCWQDVLDDVTNRLRKNKAILRFAKLKTDEDRVEFCLKDDIIRTKVLQWLNIMSSSRHKKYWEKAAELRAEGNLCFQEKEYDKAVEFYTQSILAAPFPDSEEAGSHVEELSLGFGNRSAALFHLHKYEPCLDDVHRAIHYNYPRDLRFKLLQRKGQCHMKLNQRDLAVQGEKKNISKMPKPDAALSRQSKQGISTFEESLELLEESRLDSRRIVRQKKEIENLRNLAVAMEQSPQENVKEEDRVPPLSYGIHPTIASASSAVDMLYDKTKGRHIVTNRDISAGDTLFIETPYASVLLPGHYSSHCHHCYVKYQAVIPCHQCSQVRYCCQECCDESWEKYHKWECGNLDLLHTVGVGHLCCRLVLITGLAQMQVLRDQLAKLTESSEPPGCLDGGYYGNCYFSVYHLVTHAEDRHVEDTFQYAMTALLLLLLLDKLNFFATLENPTLRERLVSCSNLSTKVNSAPSTPTHKSRSPVHSRISVASIDDSDVSPGPCTPELFVGGILLRHILQMVCNASAITELQVSPFSGESGHVLSQRQVRVATGIFPSASLMNHSCNPSVISSFFKNTLIVRAVNDLESGSEVYNCYGPHYRRMPREDRQRALLEQYFFLCECDACVNEDDREQKFQALKCAHCSGPLRAPDTSNRTSCMDCDKDQDCAGQLQKVFTAHDLFVQGLQLAARGSFKELSPPDAIERLKRCHRMREKVMYQYNRQLAEVQDQLACCYASLGKMMLAVEYLRPTLVTTENIYGANSIELANELQKYSDLLLSAIAQLSKEGASCSQDLRSLMEEAEAVLDRACHIFSIHYGLQHVAVHELKEKKLQLKAFEV